MVLVNFDRMRALIAAVLNKFIKSRYADLLLFRIR